MPRLELYATQLAHKLQLSWEDFVRQDYENQLRSAKEEDLRGNLQMHLDYQRDGVYDYGRHYRVVEREDIYQIVWDCNVTGMPKIHCVINKETGDLARYSTELINEAFFQYNLNDKGSRICCLSEASFNGEYLSLD